MNTLDQQFSRPRLKVGGAAERREAIPDAVEVAEADLRRLIVSRVAAGETRKHVGESLGLSAAYVGKVVRAGIRPPK